MGGGDPPAQFCRDKSPDNRVLTGPAYRCEHTHTWSEEIQSFPVSGRNYDRKKTGHPPSRTNQPTECSDAAHRSDRPNRPFWTECEGGFSKKRFDPGATLGHWPEYCQATLRTLLGAAGKYWLTIPSRSRSRSSRA